MTNNAAPATQKPVRQHSDLPYGELLPVLLLTILVCAFRAYCIRYYDVMSADGTGYASSGRGFFQTFDPKAFGEVMPPLYPFLIGLFDLVFHDLELSARLVSVLTSSLTIIPLYLLSRDFFSVPAAWVTVLLFSTLPFIHGMSGIDITEPSYTFLVIAGVYLVWSGYRGPRPLLRSAGGGALLGAGYLARPEGFIVAFVMTLFMVLCTIRPGNGDAKRIWIRLALFWCGFMILALPYMSYLHHVTGHWQLSGKSTLNASMIRQFQGSETADSQFRLDNKRNMRGGGEMTLTDLIRHEPAVFWRNVNNNLSILPGAFMGVLPGYLWPLVLIGLFSTPWRGTALLQRALLVATCAPLAIYVLYFIQSRGFYAYVPVLLVWCGAGGLKLTEWFCRLVHRDSHRNLIAIAAALLLSVWYVYSVIPGPKPPYHYSQDGGRFDDKQVGQRLKGLIPDDSIIMTRSGRIAFYAQRPWVIPPQGSFEEIIAFAREKKVGYLIATIQILEMRPQLEALYAPLLEPGKPYTPPFGMELVYVGQEPGGLPYIVYRFHPGAVR